MNDTQHENHFTDNDGRPAGGISTGIGYTIAWQNGPCPIIKDVDGNDFQPERNGAFLIEVLEACRARLLAYQSGEFACVENSQALTDLEYSITHLETRRDRRKDAGTLGTHEKD